MGLVVVLDVRFRMPGAAPWLQARTTARFLPDSMAVVSHVELVPREIDSKWGARARSRRLTAVVSKSS